jgi:hypothetical protein
LHLYTYKCKAFTITIDALKKVKRL